MGKKIAAIICAAGASSRFGGQKKKPFVTVGGKAAFLRSVEVFTDHEDVKQVILAISPEDQEMVKVNWGANLTFFGVQICFGGQERFDTVNNALKLVRDDIELIAVHDAARCCITKAWIDGVFQLAAKTGAAMLGSPVVATLKKVKDGQIIGTVERSGLFEAQTPQVFAADLLKQAYANLGKLDKKTISDDSGLVEALGKKVSIFETDVSNIKITKISDVIIAEAIIKSRPKPKIEGYKSPFEEAQW